MISCLCTTYNRYPKLGWLLEEAVESFLRQDYPDCELLICNDASGQRLIFDHPRVRIFNIVRRFPTLSDKIQFLIDQAEGDILCRWDDDDVSLPHRLSFSLSKLGDRLEWRPVNYFYDPGHMHPVEWAGNSHIMSLWRRAVLSYFKQGKYPMSLSGIEDQAFNTALDDAGISDAGEVLPISDIFYVYRRATGSLHLSGKTDKDNPLNPHQAHYDHIGTQEIIPGGYQIRPHWKENYIARAQQRERMSHYKPRAADEIMQVRNQFSYRAFYDDIVPKLKMNARVVEVGCYHGASLCYLATLARNRGLRIQVTGVDLGVGANIRGEKDELLSDYAEIPHLLGTIHTFGCQDMVSVIVAESTKAAAMFADDSLDLAFLDDDHSYQFVRAGLQAWWPKIKVGGWLAGHDYTTGWPGVVKAVDEFFGVQTYSLAVPKCPGCWMTQRTI